jgi:hemin uptake protein HemP
MIITNKAVTQQGSFLLDSVVQVSGAASTRQVNSEALLGNRDTLEIQHQGERYILRQTRAGKLILTK